MSAVTHLSDFRSANSRRLDAYADRRADHVLASDDPDAAEANIAARCDAGKAALSRLHAHWRGAEGRRWNQTVEDRMREQGLLEPPAGVVAMKRRAAK